MDRRRFVAAIGGALAAPFVRARPASIPRIGFLSSVAAPAAAGRVDAFRTGLRELGYIEGSTILVEYRWADGKDERLAPLAAELVRLGVAVIVTQGAVPTAVASKASANIPVVAAISGDLVAAGLVQTFARPGGNVTGLTQISPDYAGKRMQLLRQLLPRAERVAALVNPGNPVSKSELNETGKAASALGVRLQVVGATDPAGLEPAFRAIRQERAGALLVLSDIMFLGRRDRIAALAMAERLAAIAWTSEFADAGAFASYGPDANAMHRRAAAYVDRILKGARPGELPVEQPTRFELVLNQRTARALEIPIPRMLLASADRVIE